MPSSEIHHLGVQLEQTNGYLKPEFPPDGNNSADYYDYGDNLLLGVSLGLAALRRQAGDVPGYPGDPGTPQANLQVALDSAYEAISALQNDPDFNVHDHPASMAIAVHLLHALAACHAALVGKEDMWK